MSKISRPAADKIRQMWQRHKAQSIGGAGFADPGNPIRLGKTTVDHPAGETHTVKLCWGKKGEEIEGVTKDDTVEVFNRFRDLGADEFVHIARIGVGWETLGGGGGTQTVRFTILSVDCEACTALAAVVGYPPGGFTQGDYSNPYSEYGTTIDIVDLAGCFLNAPEADLIGAIGYAVRLYHDDGAFDRCAIGAGIHWNIMSLCCYGARDCGSGSA